jgi:hypothetical protein
MGLAVLGPVMRFEKDVRERFRKYGGRLSGLGIIAAVAAPASPIGVGV